MSADFDPYYRWLGIPPDERPIDYYRLLGLRKYENDADVIENAADQRMAHIRTFKTGKNSHHSQPILNELSTARVCLLNSEKKAAYDQKLRAESETHLLAASANSLPVAQSLPAQPMQQFASSITIAKSTGGSIRPARKWVLPVAVTAISVVVLAIVVVVVVISLSGPDQNSVADSDAGVRAEVKENDSTADQDGGAKTLTQAKSQPDPKSDTTITGNGQTAIVERTFWRYVKNGETGTIAHQGTARWLETQSNGAKVVFEETERTDDFVQIYDRNRQLSLRIYSEYGTWRRDGQETWQRLAWDRGGWIKPSGQTTGTSPEAVGKPAGPATQYALRFAEETDRVELAASRGLVAPDRPFTVEAWLRPSDGETSGWCFGDSMKANAGTKSTSSTPAQLRPVSEPAVGSIDLRNWGKPIDPTGKCRFVFAGDGLTIENPGALGLSVEIGNMDAPRLLRDVVGDFSITVKLEDEFVPGAQTGNRVSFNGAGLVLMQDDRTYIRLERAVFVRGKANHYASFELRENGKVRRFAKPSDMPLDPDAPTSLRLERRGDEIRASVRQGGKAWRAIEPMRVDFPKTLKLGIAAMNNTDKAFVPRFSELTFLPEPQSGQPPTEPVASGTSDSGQPGWHLLLHEGIIAFGNETVFGIKLPQTNNGGWRHVAVCSDGKQVRLYVDGKNRSEFRMVQSLGWEPSSSNICLGSSPHQSTSDRWSLRGDLAGFRISEVCRYTGFFSPPSEFQNDSQTSVLLNFSKPENNVITDLSGKGHNGMIQGAQWTDLTQPEAPLASQGAPNNSNNPLNGSGTMQQPPPMPKDTTDTKHEIPSEARLAVARQELRSVFDDEFSAAQNQPEKIALAKKLLKLVEEGNDDPSTIYALYDESLKLSIEAEQIDFAYSIFERMEGSFKLDACTGKLGVLQRCAELARSLQSRKEVTAQALALSDACLGEWRLDIATEAVQLAYTSSLRINDTALRRQVRERRDEISKLKKQAELAELAATRLKTETDNPQANLAYGKFVCLVRHDWAVGLAHLAKGSDQALKAAAELDLADPREVDAQLHAADAWSDAGTNANEPEKQAILRRALTWYQRAAGAATGLAKARAEKRIEELSSLLPEDTATQDYVGDGLVGRMFSQGRDLGVYVTYLPGRKTRNIYTTACERGAPSSTSNVLGVDLVGKLSLSEPTTVTMRTYCTTSVRSRLTSTLYIDGKPASVASGNQRAEVQIKLTGGTHNVRWTVAGPVLLYCEIDLVDASGAPLKIYHTKEHAKAAGELPTAVRLLLHQ